MADLLRKLVAPLPFNDSNQTCQTFLCVFVFSWFWFWRKNDYSSDYSTHRQVTHQQNTAKFKCRLFEEVLQKWLANGTQRPRLVPCNYAVQSTHQPIYIKILSDNDVGREDSKYPGNGNVNVIVIYKWLKKLEHSLYSYCWLMISPG